MPRVRKASDAFIRDRIKGSRNEEKKEQFQTMGQVSKGSNEIPWHVMSVNSSIDQIQIPHSFRNYPVKEVLYAGWTRSRVKLPSGDHWTGLCPESNTTKSDEE